MNYSILDPTGNITAIIDGISDLGSRNLAAAEVMSSEPDVEQAGFLFPGYGTFDAELLMAGGEFCGNASMSAAAVTAIKEGVAAGKKRKITLRVSGANDLVTVDLEAISKTSFKGRVSMPEALKVSKIALDNVESEIPLVTMPGIVHAIAPESLGECWAKQQLPLLCGKLKAEAMGVMLVSENWSRITPVVYVPGAGTLVREHSCASGTAAVGAYLSAAEGSHIRKSFVEPGGILTVEAWPDSHIYIEGVVSLVKNGSIL